VKSSLTLLPHALLCRSLAAWTVIAAFSLVAAPAGFAQSVSVSRVGDSVVVRSSGLGFIKGEALVRLKDGRSVRVEIGVAVVPRPGAPPSAERRETFVLSYDLWEEKFAVTHVAAPEKSIAYLTASAAEAWCLEHVTIPVASLGRYARDPFWVRLGHRILDVDSRAADSDPEFSLRGLIDALSKRRKPEALTHSIEAGPFRLRE
jgi:hypothetical protein